MIHVQFLLLLLVVTNLVYAEEYHSLHNIRREVSTFVKANFIGEQTATVEVSELDSRLLLPQCRQKLAMSPAHESNSRRHLSIVVKCSQPAWMVTVPVQMEFMEYVYLAKRAILRGDVVMSDDVEKVLRSTAQLPASYITKSEDLISRRVKRPIPAGSIISPYALEINYVVKRGDIVTLTVNAAGLEVRMQGQAMSDGNLNQLIQVKNLRSQRIVEGIVAGQGTVNVKM